MRYCDLHSAESNRNSPTSPGYIGNPIRPEKTKWGWSLPWITPKDSTSRQRSHGVNHSKSAAQQMRYGLAFNCDHRDNNSIMKLA